MAFDRYQVSDDGGYAFEDSKTGQTIHLAPTPSVLAHAKQIDARALYAEAGKQAAEVEPVPAVSATTASEREMPAVGGDAAKIGAALSAPPAGAAKPGATYESGVVPIVGQAKAAPDEGTAALVRGVAAAGGVPTTVQPKTAVGTAGAAGAATVPFHKPGAAAGAEPEEGGITPTGKRALAARERHEASLRRGFGGSKATPEFEQNQHYQDTSTRGPADEYAQRENERLTGPAPFEAGKYEAPRLDPKTLAGLVGLPTGEDLAALDASLPPNANGSQAQAAWYAKLADEVAGGVSIASLRARYGGGLPHGAPPKDPKKMAEWAKGIEAQEARQGRVAEILDGKIAEHRKGFEASEGARAKEHAGKVETFGPRGEAGEREHELRQQGRQLEFEAERAGEAGELNANALEKEAAIQSQLATDLRAKNAEIGRVQAEIEKGEIDPDRLWKAKSAGEKVWSVVSRLIAGMGGVEALKVHTARVTSEIDRDIDAQKANLNKKQGKLSSLQQVYANMIAAGASDMAATEAMRKASLLGVEQMIRKNAALTGSDLKMRNADRAVAALRAQENARDAAISAGRRGGRTMAGAVIPARAATAGGRNLKLEAQEAERTAELEQKLGKGAAETSKLNAEAAAPGGKAPQRFVSHGHTFQAMNVYGEGEGADLRKKFGSIDTLANILTKIEKLGPIDKLTPTGKRQVENLVGQYVSQEQKMLGEGVTRESDVDRAMRVQASVFSGRDVVKDLREIHGDIREHNMQQAGAKLVAAR